MAEHLLAERLKELLGGPSFVAGLVLLTIGAIAVLVALAPARVPRSAQGEGRSAVRVDLLNAWVGAFAMGAVLLVAGIAYHPSLIAGGVFLLTMSGIRLLRGG